MSVFLRFFHSQLSFESHPRSVSGLGVLFTSFQSTSCTPCGLCDPGERSPETACGRLSNPEGCWSRLSLDLRTRAAKSHLQSAAAHLDPES